MSFESTVKDDPGVVKVPNLAFETLYNASDVADLYFQMWEVELFFGKIKTTMGMDILRCQPPGMICKRSSTAASPELKRLNLVPF